MKKYQIGERYLDEWLSDEKEIYFTVKNMLNDVKTDLHVESDSFKVKEKGITYNQIVTHYQEKLIGTVAVDGWLDHSQILGYSSRFKNEEICEDFYLDNPDLLPDTDTLEKFFNDHPRLKRKPDLNWVLKFGIATVYYYYEDYCGSKFVSPENNAESSNSMDFIVDGQYYTIFLNETMTIPLTVFIGKKEGDHIRFVRKYNSLNVHDENGCVYPVKAEIVFDICLNGRFISAIERSKNFEDTLEEFFFC